MSEEMELEVRVNGEFAGYVSVSEDASKRDKLFAALSVSKAKEMIGESTVKANPVITENIIDIVA